MYWVGLTMFQTGLPYFVQVSMRFDSGFVIVFMGGMMLLAAVFYPFVTKFVKKWGKKRLVIFGFLGLAICYGIAAIASIPGVCPDSGSNNGLSWLFGILIMVISALPMALLGIIPQSMVADVAEAEARATGQNREGMFFAARTFAMKFGQSLAMLLFTSLAIIGATVDKSQNDITATKIGMLVVAIVAVAFCIFGAVILAFYREKKIMLAIAKEEDKAFLNAIKDEKDPGEQPTEEGNDVSGDNAGEQ
jgi:GPH family glycoside/pentoside/hexuronide:cation symporter